MHNPWGATPRARLNHLPAVPHLRTGTTGALELLCLLAALLLMAACGGPGPSSSSGPASHPSVHITCNPSFIHPGETSQCTATVTGTGSDASAVKWFVQDVEGGDSTVGTISTSGLYTAPSSVPKAKGFAVSARIGTLSNGSFAITGITVSP